MNHIGPLLTRENLLSYCKDSAEELQKEKNKLRNLEWLRDHIVEPWSPDYWSILIRIFKTQERVKEAKESLVVYQEQLEFLSIG